MSAKPTVPIIRTESLDVPFRYKSMQEAEWQRPPSKEPAHRHDYFVLILVEQAKGTHQLDFRDYPLEAYTVYCISPEQVHQIDVEAGPRGHVLLFTADFLQSHSLPPEQLFDLGVFFDCEAVPPLQLPPAARPEFLQLIGQIACEYRSDHPLRLDMIGTLLKLLLLKLQRISSQTIPSQLPPNQRKAEIVRQFKKTLEHSFRQEHQVRHYAAAQQLTANYLNEVIKAETGRSVKDFIQDRIVLEARRIALFSDSSMKQIAWQLGFEDAAHFSKLFKKRQGITFSAFRRQISASFSSKR
ncbi:MAG: helix-turn-helix transcriptional regulator [Bacteroidota bacterium]